MASAAQLAAILPHRFTPERARAARAKAAPALKIFNAKAALARSLRTTKTARVAITGPLVVALLSEQQQRIALIESQLRERAPLSRREYIERGVERHLGPAINPPQRPPSRRKRDEQADANRVARGERPLGGMLASNTPTPTVQPAPAEAFASPLALGPAAPKS